MDSITFNNVIPQVFALQPDMSSDLWGKTVVFPKGQLCLVEAASGKGKSTFCSYIVGYRHDYSGRVLFDKNETRSLRVRDWVDIRRRHISCLFQELRLFPELTAWENVIVKNNLTHFKEERVLRDWFDRLGIGDKLQTKAGLMSFGQQQRVAMIRALAQPFDFLLADEPISHLDDKNASVMADMMMEEAKRQGASVIVTSIGKHMDLNYKMTVKL